MYGSFQKQACLRHSKTAQTQGNIQKVLLSGDLMTATYEEPLM